MTPEDWFATSTDWIDGMRAPEFQLQTQINESAAIVQDTTRWQLLTNGLTVGLALLLLSLQLLFPPKEPRAIRSNAPGLGNESLS